MAHGRERPAGLACGDGLRRGHVVRRRVEVLVEAEEVDLGEVEVHDVRLRLLPELREVRVVEARGALELGAARLVLLRARVKGGRVVAQRLLDRGRRRRDVRRVALRARPRTARRVLSDRPIEGRLQTRVVLERRVPCRDLQHPLPGVAARGLELEEELVGFDAALVVRLVVVLLGERADDLAAEALAADLRQEGVEVLRGVLLVFGEHLDDVAKGLALQLVELLALRRVRSLAPAAGIRGLEDADEPAGGLVVVADAPVAPGALEERQTVERGVDLVLVRQDLLVLGQGACVVELAVEHRLGLRHVGVGNEAALRIVAKDALEAIARLFFLALLVCEEAVYVEGEVVLFEPGIVAQHAGEEVPWGAVVELGRGTPGVDGLLLPVLEALDEHVAGVLPLEFT